MVALIGCGRFGFDDRNDGGTVDALVDAPPGVASCQARQVMSLGTQPIGDLGVAKMPNGYALGFVEAPSGILWGTVLDNQLAATNGLPQMTSTSTYANVTLTWTGANLLAGIGEPNGLSYLKRLEPDMSTYTQTTEVTGAAADPAFAAAGGQWFGGAAAMTQTAIYSIAADGSVSAGPSALGDGTSIDGMSLASSGPFAVIAWARPGTCLASVVDAGVNVATTILGFACPDSQLAGDTPLHLVYTRAGSIAYRTLSVGQGKSVSASSERVVGTGSRPQVITAGGNAYVGWTSDTMHIARVTSAGLEDFAVLGLPTALPSAWQLVDLGGAPGAVAVFGAELYAVDRCN